MIQSVSPGMVNEVIMVQKNEMKPTEGMLGTYYVGSDRYAVGIVKVLSPKKIRVVTIHNNILLRDKAVKDGNEFISPTILEYIYDGRMPVRSDYDNEPDGDELFKWRLYYYERDHTYTLRKNGRWVQEGKPLWFPGAVHLGKADPYLDPCF